MLKYSVIIPVYQAEKTLNRCLDSLLAENYSDCEIILVNDGSKDRSGEICAGYAEAYPCVRCLSKENGGVSSARNAGLDAARGEYIVFVDSDDSVMPGFFAALDTEREKYKADWFFFSCCFDNGNEVLYSRNNGFFSADREETLTAVLNAICRKTINGPYAKLFRRDIIEEFRIRFPTGVSVGEDRAFNICYSFHTGNLLISEKNVYCVNTENEQSLSRKRHADLDEQFAVADRYLDEALLGAPISEMEKERYRRALNFGSCRGVYHEAKLMHEDRLRWPERQKRLGKLCDDINRRHLKYPDTRYCTLISLPIRLRLTPIIDAVAWRLINQRK